MTRLLRLTGNISLAATKDSKRRISIVAYTGGAMTVSGWGSIVVDLDGLTLPSTIPILAAHENTLDSLVGQGIPSIDKSTLTVDAELAPGPAGDRVHELLAAGVKLKASVGAEVVRSSYVHEAGKVKVNGKAVAAGVIVAHEATLGEVSVLPIGADGSTSVSLAASAAKDKDMLFSEWVDSLSIAVTDANRGRLEAEHARLYPPAESPASASVLARYLDRWPDVLVQAVGAGWTEAKAKDEALVLTRASRPNIRSASQRDDGPDRGNIVTAGLLLNMGLAPKRLAEWYDERTIDAGTRRENRTIGIQGLMRQTIAAAGGTPPSGKFTDSAIRDAFDASRHLQASGLSTLSLPGILGNTANKAMIASFTGVATTWGKFCKIGTHDDFKEHTLYRLTGKGEFAEIGKGGKIKHVTLEEGSDTNTLKSYGALISLERQTIINDDLGAFAAIPQVLGRMSAIKVEKSVYTLLLSNPSSFFATANLNYIEGATTTLLTDGVGLGLGWDQWKQQTDANGDPTLLDPAILLVPPALTMDARVLMNSNANVGSTTANALMADNNPWAGMFEVVTGEYLSTAFSLTGASNTAWYLAAGPGDYAMMQVAFLNGTQFPTAESGELNYDELGFYTRAYFDFSPAMFEHRGGLLSKGAA